MRQLAGRLRYVADECNVTPRNEMLIVRATTAAAAAAAAAAGVVLSRARSSQTHQSVTDVKLDEHAALCISKRTCRCCSLAMRGSNEQRFKHGAY